METVDNAAFEILVVDDKPANIQLLAELLTKAGYRVKGAPGGSWALKTLAVSTPDLILLDIRMPDINGFEVCKKIKEDDTTKNIPVIFISALDNVEDKVTAFEAGGVDYISKPFENSEVLARVKTHLLINGLQKELSGKNSRLEEEIKKSKHYESRFIQQSKTAAMGEMMGVITHQWKHPLNSIALYAQNINETVEYEECSKEQMNDIQEHILEQVRHMNTTIEDFKNFYKPSTAMTDFKACELAIDTFRLVEAKMKKAEVAFITHKHEHFMTRGYPSELKHVILNIYNNAYDTFKEKGIKDKKIELFLEHNGDTGVIKIRDNAGGIPQDLFPDKLFEPYITTKGDSGTGIGMHISKVIVEEKLGGSIEAGNVDGGAEFIITLPLAKEE